MAPCKKDDFAKIGTCGFHFWDTSTGVCDIGYDVYPDFQGKGYMSEALQVIIPFE
jgi:ribosomal-protein-alanine N-acetyltransferase